MMYHLPDDVGRNEKSVLLDSPGITRDLTDDSMVLLMSVWLYCSCYPSVVLPAIVLGEWMTKDVKDFFADIDFFGHKEGEDHNKKYVRYGTAEISTCR